MVHRRIDTDATDKRGLPGGWANGISEAGDRTVASTENKLLFQTSQILLFGNSSPWSSAEVVQGHEIPLREFPKIAVVCKNTHEDW